MKEKVYVIPIVDNEPDEEVCRKLQAAIRAKDLFSFIQARDLVAFLGSLAGTIDEGEPR